jgi:hypothetical protein
MGAVLFGLPSHGSHTINGFPNQGNQSLEVDGENVP